MSHPDALAHAAALIVQADGLLVAAGAGIGVDSGLPDFRGADGFWQAYPALGRAGIDFHAIASPAAFRARPRQAWGFYGHRLALYRRTRPHAGFEMLQRWGAATPHGYAVFTSNVDGQFQRAGFAPERIRECHGSIHRLQCRAPCSDAVWSADGFEPEVDDARCLLRNDAPTCPRCGALARPNILMFGDADWISRDDDAQAERLADWAARVRRPVVVEVGAGTDVPSVRHFTALMQRHRRARLVRINPREVAVASGDDVGLAMGALHALAAIDDLITTRRIS